MWFRPFAARWIVLLSALALAPSSALAGDDLNLVPWPREVTLAEGELTLGATARIVATDERLLPLARLLADEIERCTGRRLETGGGPAVDGDIELRLLPAAADADTPATSPPREGYTLHIADRATIEANTYAAAAQGTVALLQALRRTADGVSLPKVTIHDGPKLAYCGAMLDVARKPYSIEQLRQCVDVCRFYKIRHLHLHLTDENAWTFPSTAFPQLGSQNFAWAGGEAPRPYPIEELKALVAYAETRGVTLVPEIEFPGHSGQLRGTLPEIFGYRDAEGNAVSLGVVNMVSERADAAIETLIAEACDIFAPSPFIHLGGDESSLGGIEQMPEVTEFVARHNLPDPYSIFNSFLHRMHDMVASRGKRLILWEGAPNGPRPLPKDVIFMPWVGGSPWASELVRDGYDVINAPWGVERPYFDPYLVNGAQLERGEPRLFGATSILWESVADKAVPYLRFTGALRNEPAYNPDSGRGLEDFLPRIRATDARLDQLLYGFTFRAACVLQPDETPSLDVMFVGSMILHLDQPTPRGEVRFTTDGTPVAADSSVFPQSLSLGDTTTIRARLFADTGEPLGAEYVRAFTRLTAVPHAAERAVVTLDPERPGYYGPGPQGLTDGYLAATNDFYASGWVGWQNFGQPVSVTLDLGGVQEVRTVSAHFLRSAGGVFPPQTVSVALSDDGQTFRDVGTVDKAVAEARRGWYVVDLPGEEARYVRLTIAHSADWTFIDEVALDGELPGPTQEHAAQGRAAVLAHPPTAYTSPGVEGLTDGHVSQAANFLSLEWLGFEGQPLAATIDLGRSVPLARVGGRFLQDVRAGIYVPHTIEVFVSDDGVEFRSVGRLERDGDQTPLYVQPLAVELTDVSARFVRFVAHPSGQWLFVDEVLVEAVE